MKAFGILNVFIGRVRKIYANTMSVININIFSQQIPLKRGVRQRCPLSAMICVLAIEILALQIRNNPNIVGFQNWKRNNSKCTLHG